MRTYNYLLMVLAFVLASLEIGAAEVPREVLKGWDNLRSDSGTYHYEQSRRQENSQRQMGVYQVSARLKDTYAKSEMYFQDAKVPHTQNDIHRVVLYDGDEYYHLERIKRDSQLVLKASGKTQPGSLSLRIGESFGPMAGNVDLYDCVRGKGDCNLLDYEGPTASSQLAKIVLGPREGYQGTLERLEVWLDSKENYRIAKTLQTVNLADGNSSDGRYTSEATYEYAETESIPSKVRTSTTKLGSVRSENYPPVIGTLEHQLPRALPKSHFTLEHYGLASRKRKSYAWIYTLVALTAIAVGAAAYRRLRANAA